MKKILVALLVLIMVFSVVACGGEEEEEEAKNPPYVVMVADSAGLGDESFNDSCWSGCERAAEEFGLEIYCLEVGLDNKYYEKIEEAANMEPELIICAGAPMEGALIEAAAKFPDQKFAIIDANELGDNIAGITFTEHEGSFLAGIAAAMMTESNIVSFIGGEQNAVIDRFQYGFEAGVATVSKDIYINTQYIGDFVDKDMGRTLAGAHIALGTDVIYPAAGAAGLGVIEVAEAKEIWAIGVDTDQSKLAEDTIMCSMVKRADNAAYNVISEVVSGGFDGSDEVYSLADGGVGISDNAGNLPEEVQNAIEEYTEKIVSGELTVPYDWQTWYDYSTTLD